jgi:hypothetical protein
MAFEGVPWMIGGSALHSAEVGRQLAFMASSGATGVTLPTDLRVTALPTAGSSVRINPGGGPIANTYPGASGQSYVVRNPSATDLPVPATGSGGGATRYVIVRIDDPQYGGQVPANPVVGPYVYPTLVSSLTGITYPHMVLARIDQPANTATITQAMITDLREVAVPRSLDIVRANPTIYTDTGLTLANTTTGGEQFPDNAFQDVKVPTWATRMQVRAEWLAVRYGATNKWGQYWLHYGRPAIGYEHETQRFSFDSSNPVIYRTNWILADDRAVPAALRGQTIRFWPQARISGGTTGAVTLDATSGLSFSVRFQEVADSSSA